MHKGGGGPEEGKRLEAARKADAAQHPIFVRPAPGLRPVKAGVVQLQELPGFLHVHHCRYDVVTVMASTRGGSPPATHHTATAAASAHNGAATAALGGCRPMLANLVGYHKYPGTQLPLLVMGWCVGGLRSPRPLYPSTHSMPPCCCPSLFSYLPHTP